MLSASILPEKASDTVICVLLTRLTLLVVTPSMPDTDTVPEVLKERPLSVSVTTLPLSVASVKGVSVVAVIDSSTAVTGS